MAVIARLRGALAPARVSPAPRFREIGAVVLDALHHDARIDAEWLALGEAEFALLWALADGECVEAGEQGAPFERLRTCLAAYDTGFEIVRRPDGRCDVVIQPRREREDAPS